MKIVFFGSSKYSATAAKIIQDKLGLSLIVTNPDKLGGRNRQLIISPVKQFAQNNQIPFLTLEKLDQKATETIVKYQPDFLVVVDYGLILPRRLLDLPKYAALNVHHSLLPKYRGPTPAPTAILEGDKKSGVTIISMTEQVDAGDILAQEEYTLASDETTDSLLTKLNTLGGQLVCEVINSYVNFHPRGGIKTKPGEYPGGGSDRATIFLPPKPQDETKATYSHWLTKKGGQINPKNPPDPQIFDRMVRAFYPWPGVWTELRIKNYELRIKFLPPTILLASPAGGPSHKPTDPFLIQPEGKKPMLVKEFLNGYPEAKELIEKLTGSRN